MDNLSGNIITKEIKYIVSSQGNQNITLEDMTVYLYRMGNRAKAYICGYVTKGQTNNHFGYTLKPQESFPNEFVPDLRFSTSSVLFGTYEHFTAEMSLNNLGEIGLGNGSNNAVGKSWIMGFIEYVPYFR